MKKAAASQHCRGPDLPAETRRRLRQLNLRARKGLGQHFLVDAGVLEVILAAAGLAPDDVVIEVGPGLGVLTRELAKQASRVIAVEIDDRLASALTRELASFGNVTIVNRDILDIDPADLLREQASGGLKYKVVANLPYYITSPVLRHFLEASQRPQTMVVMVQREVAEQIAAPPGQMSLLSVSVQFYGGPEVVSYVPARCFYPAPEVDSAVLRINVRPQPLLPVADEGGFFVVVRAGFRAPRKQIANSLSRGLGLSRAEVLPLLAEAGIAPQRRAETLALDEWVRLWQVCVQAGKVA